MKNNINEYSIYLSEDLRIRAWMLGAPIDVKIGTSGVEWIAPVTAEQLFGWLKDKLNFLKIDIKDIQNHCYTHITFVNEDVIYGNEYEKYDATLIDALTKIINHMEMIYKK